MLAPQIHRHSSLARQLTNFLTQNDQRSCYTCGIPGHISRDCPTQGGVVSVNPNFVPFNGGFRGGGGGGGGGGYGGNRPRGVCYDWQKGECDRGNACRFAHSEDTQEFSNTNEGGGNPNFGRSRGVCFDWQKGACERGDNCRFTHSNENEGGTGSSYPTFSRPRFQGNGRQGQGNVRPGDWTCPACSVNNFASRINCFKCE